MVGSSSSPFRPAVLREQAAHHETHHHASHPAQELGHRQTLARRIRLPHHRMPTERFERRSGRRPHEVRATDASIPEVVQAPGDVFLHLGEHPPVPAGPGRRQALLAHEPDGGGEPGATGHLALPFRLIGHEAVTTKPARISAETSVSQASGCLLANTTTSRPSSTRASRQRSKVRSMPSS